MGWLTVEPWLGGWQCLRVSAGGWIQVLGWVVVGPSVLDLVLASWWERSAPEMGGCGIWDVPKLALAYG